MGGDLSLQSQPGEGATFILSLRPAPAAPAEERGAPARNKS
jgi:signal transduction histidine kinase